MTLRLYAEHKKLPLDAISVTLSHAKIHAQDCEECETKEGKIDRIERVLTLAGDLSDEQRARLIEIADKCPVHRTLTSEVNIRTDGEADGLTSAILRLSPARRRAARCRSPCRARRGCGRTSRPSSGRASPPGA